MRASGTHLSEEERLMPTTPQDVLPDGAEGGYFGGTYVRKGSVGAFIANAKALGRLAPGSAEYEEVASQMQSLKPALDAIGLFDVFDIRDQAVAAIVTAG
jgi:hypothetical protein